VNIAGDNGAVDPCLHTAVVSPSSSPEAVSAQYDQESAPKASHHAFEPRLTTRESGNSTRIAGEGFASSHFFPPVRLGSANRFQCQPGLYHSPVDALPGPCNPSISSYSAKPLRQSFTNTPFLFHSRKYLCTELALPYSSFATLSTGTLSVNKNNGSEHFPRIHSLSPSPKPRRKYFRLLSRLGSE